jgi:hypothetical protein
MSSLQFRLAGQKARMLPHPAHLTCVTQNCTSSLNPPLKRRLSMKSKSIGLLLLGIWLIVTGLAQLLHFSFSGMGTVMAVVATVAGALIILGL